jgi:hypothetical protein
LQFENNPNHIPTLMVIGFLGHIFPHEIGFGGLPNISKLMIYHVQKTNTKIGKYGYEIPL